MKYKNGGRLKIKKVVALVDVLLTTAPPQCSPLTTPLTNVPQMKPTHFSLERKYVYLIPSPCVPSHLPALSACIYPLSPPSRPITYITLLDWNQVRLLTKLSSWEIMEWGKQALHTDTLYVLSCSLLSFSPDTLYLPFLPLTSPQNPLLSSFYFSPLDIATLTLSLLLSHPSPCPILSLYPFNPPAHLCSSKYSYFNLGGIRGHSRNWNGTSYFFIFLYLFTKHSIIIKLNIYK